MHRTSARDPWPPRRIATRCAGERTGSAEELGDAACPAARSRGARSRTFAKYCLRGGVGIALAACNPGGKGITSATTGPTGTTAETETETETEIETEIETETETETSGGALCSPGDSAKGPYADAPFGAGLVVDGDEACAPPRLFATGEVNGDGRADIVLHGQTGRLFVIFGGDSPGRVDLAAIAAGDGGYVVEPGAQGAIEWRAYGDVNGDGRLDFAALTDASRTLVVFGVDATSPILLDDVAAGVGGFAVEHGEPWSMQRVDQIADIDGDGLGDLLFGGEGSVHVLFGADEPAAATLADVSAGVGGFAEDLFIQPCGPNHVVAVGDVDGDGFADLAATESLDPDRCGVGPGSTDPTIILRGRAPGGMPDPSRAYVPGLYGGVVLGPGDVDGDGFAEFLIEGSGGRFSGTPISNPSDGFLVYYGRAEFGEYSVGLAATAPCCDDEGEGWTPDLFEVRGVADVNADTRPDMLVANGDETYVVFGALPIPYEWEDDQPPAPYALGPTITADVGVHLPKSGVVALPDVSGDSVDDLAFADPTAAAGRGEVSILFGGADLSSAQAVDLTIDGEVEGDHLGAQVDAADVNGDGTADLILTAPGAGATAPGSGRVYVIFGTP